jgi:hypothetical protein
MSGGGGLLRAMRLLPFTAARAYEPRFDRLAVDTLVSGRCKAADEGRTLLLHRSRLGRTGDPMDPGRKGARWPPHGAATYCSKIVRPGLRLAQSPLSPVPRPSFGTPVPQSTRCQNLRFPKSITRSRKVRFSFGAGLCMHAPPTVRRHVPLQPPQQCLQWRTMDMCAFLVPRRLQCYAALRSRARSVLVAPFGPDQGACPMTRLHRGDRRIVG